MIERRIVAALSMNHTLALTVIVSLASAPPALPSSDYLPARVPEMAISFDATMAATVSRPSDPCRFGYESVDGISQRMHLQVATAAAVDAIPHVHAFKSSITYDTSSVATNAAPTVFNSLRFDADFMRRLSYTPSSSPKDPAGVSLEPADPVMGEPEHVVAFRLVNNSNKTIRFLRYADGSYTPMTAELFSVLQGWEADLVGWCGNDISGKAVDPQQSMRITTYRVRDGERFVRYKLHICDEGSNQSREIYSPVFKLGR